VTILALTPDGRIPLVRQFRPAVDRITLELPGGLVDGPQSPAWVAAKELREEVGYDVVGEAVLLGKMLPDTGRLENSYWGYFARATPSLHWQAESEVERTLYTPEALQRAILDGEFDHALHIALLGLAMMRGHLQWDISC
jgi:ADP-ribose pyrophosphatase